MLPVSTYLLAIIRPICYLELMKKPCNSPCINLGERFHFLYTYVIKLIKNSVKLGQTNICIKNKNILSRNCKEVKQFKTFLVVYSAHCSLCFHSLRIDNVCEDDPVLQGIDNVCLKCVEILQG
jgi:hypothetical protein